MYWCEETSENGKKVKVNHATIVTAVHDGEIYIASNTSAYADEPLSSRMGKNDENKKESIHIVHLKDECFN